jgi:GNAT superfamily N-acetyltransferase
MRRDDIPAGLRLCRHANWNQVAADWEFFLESSPQGCIVALDDAADVIGTVATIAYGDAFSWIGMVLVDPQHRRAGVGTKLLHEALEVVGKATSRLDATPAGRAVYRPLGFCDEYGLQRMVRPVTVSAGSVQPDLQIRRMPDADFADVVAYDREVFGADRNALLTMCRNEAPEYGWTIGDSRIDGYLFGRHGHSFEHLGPLVARDEATAARLVNACVSYHQERAFIIDVPLRSSWTASLESAGFTPLRPFTRMRRGEPHFQERIERTFAIAGPEFG